MDMDTLGGLNKPNKKLQLGQNQANDDEEDRRRWRHDAVRPEDSPADEPLERVPRRRLRDLRERQRRRRCDQQHVRHYEHWAARNNATVRQHPIFKTFNET